MFVVAGGFGFSVRYGTLSHPAGYAVVGIVIGGILLLWAVIARGRDLGQHPLQTLGEWMFFSLIGYVVLHFTDTGERLIYYAFRHAYIGVAVSIAVQHYYLAYLLFAPKREFVPNDSKV